MGIIIRQGLKASVFIYTGVVIGGLIQLWLLPKFLKPEEIGIINLVQSIAFLSAGVLQLGASDIVNKFLPVFFDKTSKHYGFSSFILLYLLAGFGIYAFFFILFKDFWMSFYVQESPEIIRYFYFIIPFALFIALNALLEAYIRGHLRIAIPAFFREVLQRLLMILSVFLYFFKVIGFDQLLMAIISIQLILILSLLSYIKNLQILFLPPISFQFLNKELRRDIFTFAFFIFLGGLSSQIITRVDNLMIGSFLGTAEVGVYAISAYIAGVIEIPQRALGQISTPIVAKAWKENDLAEIQQIYSKTSINLMLIGMLLFLGIWCNVDYIFQIMPNGAIYQPGKYVIFFIGLARLIDMGTGLNTLIILQSQYYRFNLLLALILAFMIVFSNWLFIDAYGIIGVAFATTISMLLYNSIKFLFLWIRFRIQPFSLASLKALLLGIGVYGSVLLLPDVGNVWGNIFITSAQISILFCGLAYWLKLSPDANGVLNKVWEVFWSRINKKR